MLVDEAGGMRRGGVLATVSIVLACVFVLPSTAKADAEIFTVDSTADEADAIPGVAGCLTAGGKCTLRAAIEESNGSLGELDEIVFDELVFDGQVAGTITLSSGLPAVVDPVRINGRECATGAGIGGPCVGVDGLSAGPALTIDNAEGVEIEGLAVTGAETGISVEGSEFIRVRANWFGVNLDGDGDGNMTAVLIGPGSDNGRIGGEGPDAGNVFADNTGDGLSIHGASNVGVLGNYFGVMRDGVTPAANGKNIEVTSTSAGEAARGTTIGTRVSSGAVATPACDGGCNLISAAASSGIDLEGDGGQEAPAVATEIAGNYVGLNATGSTSIPNAFAGIHVGRAAQTVVGGPKAGEANRINGGGAGILANPAAGDLVIRGNAIGVDAAGTGTLAAPDEGIVVNSEELSSPAVEAVISGNEIRMEGGIGITQQGFGARISGNEILDAETGIKALGYTGEHGNLIEGNSIEGLEVSGILVENDLNEILGNKISGSGGAGIWLRGLVPFGLTENLVGGDTASEENVITGSGGDAIEISSIEESENEVARNRGIANHGLFIDLVTVGVEPKGPNGGIETPEFSTLTRVSGSGSGAEAGAKVRVFRKQISELGEIESFLGEATADADGNWTVVYGETIPAGTIVAATQTSEGGTSELTVATTPADPSSGGGNGSEPGSGPGASADKTSPRTTIVKGPRKSSSSTAARFRFSSDEPGSSFQCKLDGKPFRTCKSPSKYGDLKPGKHVFKVRAIDPAGNVDSSPAKMKFTVLGGAGR